MKHFVEIIIRRLQIETQLPRLGVVQAVTRLKLRTYLENSPLLFLDPSGAQGVTLFVRLSVRAGQVCLEQSIFIFLGQRALREH